MIQLSLESDSQATRPHLDGAVQSRLEIIHLIGGDDTIRQYAFPVVIWQSQQSQRQSTARRDLFLLRLETEQCYD